jgi:nucleoside-diphosphate-sugar epimerase
MSSRSALVLGASGVIGTPLSIGLVEAGWQVVGAARFGDATKRAHLDAHGVKTQRYDLTREDPAQLPDVDVVFFEVWDRSQISKNAYDEIFALNYDAVGRVCARYAGVAHIVNGSTISLYGASAEHMPCEADAPRPDTDYGLARIAQEKLFDFLCAQAGHSRVCHLRYCRSNTPQFGTIRRFADMVLAGRSLGRNPDERTQVIALADFLRCTLLAGEWITDAPERLPGAVNIVHPRVWTVRELAERLHADMQRGSVTFERESGGSERSVWADPALMIDTFGRPTVDIDELVTAAAAAAVAAADAT